MSHIQPTQSTQSTQFPEALRLITEAKKSGVSDEVINKMVDRFYPEEGEMVPAKSVVMIIEAMKPAQPTWHQVWSLLILRLVLAAGWVATFLEMLERGYADIMTIAFLVACSAALAATFKPRF